MMIGLYIAPSIVTWKWHQLPKLLKKTMNETMQNQFQDALQSLPDFIYEMQPNWEMVYDYVCEQINEDELNQEQIAKMIKIYDDAMGYSDAG